MAFTVGVGLTLIVKLYGVPEQPLAVGVTVMFAITWVEPVLLAVKAGIFPVPLAARPIDGSLFVQLKLVPETALLKLMAEVWAPLQTIWLEGSFTSGIRFTVTVTLIGAPEHPLAVGTTL